MTALLYALDTETTIVDLRGGAKVRDTFNVPDLVCAQFWDGRNGLVRMWDEPDLEDGLLNMLADTAALVIGHNISFDLLVLLKAFPALEAPIRAAINGDRILDTMVLAKLREPCLKNSSLAALVKYHLKRELAGKGDIQVSFSRDRPLTKAQREYALDDARVTLALAKRLRGLPLGSVYRGKSMRRHEMECRENHRLPDGRAGFHPLDHVYSSCLINTRCWSEPLGWDLHPGRLERHRAEARQIINASACELHQHGLIDRVRDTDSVKVHGPATTCKRRKFKYNKDLDRWEGVQGGRWLYQGARWKLCSAPLRAALQALADELGLRDVPLSVKTQQLSMTYDYWKEHTDHMGPGLRAFMKYARAHKYESLYFAPWASSRTGRVYPSFFIPAAETLRHSASRPNVHQIAKKLREIFLHEGHSIVGADYSALECYTLCHVLVNLGLKGPLYETLAADEDMHSLTAANMLGGAPADHPKGSDTRQAAKALNFGIPGGLGVKKMHTYGKQGYGLNWSPEEAADMYWKYRAAYTDIDTYLRWFKEKKPWHLRPPSLDRDAWLRSLGFNEWPGTWDLTMALDKGRLYNVQLPTGAVIPARNYTQGTNCAFQHVGAVVTSRALNLCYDAGLPVICAVHDAIYLASSPERAEGDARLLEECMEDAIVEVCPEAPPQKVEAEIKETFF